MLTQLFIFFCVVNFSFQQGLVTPDSPVNTSSVRPIAGNIGGYGGQFGGRNANQGRTGTRQRLDGITLLLQRIGDRVMAMEANQLQRAQRIDSVNYRLTKMEASTTEIKSQLQALTSTFRHGTQSAEFANEKLRDVMDTISAGVVSLKDQQTRLIALMETRNTGGFSPSPARTSPSVATRDMVSDLQTIKTLSEGTLEKIENMATNFILLQNVSRSMEHFSSSAVTKAFMRSLTAEYTTTPLMEYGGMGRDNQWGNTEHPIDCFEVQQRLLRSEGSASSGLYLIQPIYFRRPSFAYCDMETEGGGWTVLQRRQDGSVDFLREWQDYKHGFGNLAGEFWLGNELIHALTNQRVNLLRVEMSDFDQVSAVATYSAFAVGAEAEGYSLKLLGHYSGDAGDSLSYHVGQRWSTIDSDSDSWRDKSCAREHQGAWWYRACDTSNLNGLYLHGPVTSDREYQGTYWYDFRGPQYSLWSTRMLIKRGGLVSSPVVKKPMKDPRVSNETLENKIEENLLIG